jgi:hypothetical protein
VALISAYCKTLSRSGSALTGPWLHYLNRFCLDIGTQTTNGQLQILQSFVSSQCSSELSILETGRTVPTRAGPLNFSAAFLVMASVNGHQHPECEDPAHDSNSNLLRPHGSERQDAMSTVGGGGGRTAAWGPEGSTIYHTPLISISPGAQDGKRQSTVPRTRRIHYTSVLETQSLNFIVSFSISYHRLGYSIVQSLGLFTMGIMNKCIVHVYC